VPAQQMTPTGCRDQGALRLKHRRPNEHSAMSTKPTPQTAQESHLAFESMCTALQSQNAIAPAAASRTAAARQQGRSPTAQSVDSQATLLRLPTVMHKTGLGRSTIYKLVSTNAFPAPIKLTTRSVAWLQREIDIWVASRARASRAAH
jgi:prophage regulatory protein